MEGERKKYKKQLNDLRKETKGKSFKNKIEIIALNYFNRNLEDKKLLEYKLIDLSNDIDKLSLLSLILIFLTPIINIVITQRNIILGVCTCITEVFAMYIMVNETIKNYRFYKMYLEVIKDIKSGVIAKNIKRVETIEFVDIPIKSIEIKNSLNKIE
ncbi:hypothetical protein [Clostridium sp. HBUAS56017]|uniref:hypothetical protein n=1 Tax=Clostridium sp. HBUAS56017 TaxID=2571128 RepID=UPI001177F7FB|nr:hypothetical protein [Clostridium sp. HBUAS56017]